MIRNLVSGQRHRYTDDLYNLDLTYIKPNLVAMGYPSTGIKTIFKNSIHHVKKLFETKHENHYYIINLTEKEYDQSYFNNRVLHIGFPDHHPPQFDLLISLILFMQIWLSLDKKNIVAVHCEAGKGRTGVVIVCYMIYEYIAHNCSKLIDLSLVVSKMTELFYMQRGEGIEYINQHRIVYEFSSLLLFYLQNRPKFQYFYVPPPVLFISYIRMNNPNYIFYIYQIQKDNKYELIFNSNWLSPEPGQDNYTCFCIHLCIKNEVYIEISDGIQTLGWIYLNTRFIINDSSKVSLNPRDFDCEKHKHLLGDNFHFEFYYDHDINKNLYQIYESISEPIKFQGSQHHLLQCADHEKNNANDIFRPPITRLHPIMYTLELNMFNLFNTKRPCFGVLINRDGKLNLEIFDDCKSSKPCVIYDLEGYYPPIPYYYKNSFALIPLSKCEKQIIFEANTHETLIRFIYYSRLIRNPIKNTCIHSFDDSDTILSNDRDRKTLIDGFYDVYQPHLLDIKYCSINDYSICNTKKLMKKLMSLYHISNPSEFLRCTYSEMSPYFLDQTRYDLEKEICHSDIHYEVCHSSSQIYPSIDQDCLNKWVDFFSKINILNHIKVIIVIIPINTIALFINNILDMYYTSDSISLFSSQVGRVCQISNILSVLNQKGTFKL